MDLHQWFAQICSVPNEFSRSGLPLRDVVKASGYSELRGQFAARELAAFLRARPAIIEQWVGFSADKRTSDGWYLRPPCSIGRISPEPPPMHEVKHIDLAAACAAFIIAELDDILDRAPADQ